MPLGVIHRIKMDFYLYFFSFMHKKIPIVRRNR